MFVIKWNGVLKGAAAYTGLGNMLRSSQAQIQISFTLGLKFPCETKTAVEAESGAVVA